MNAVAIAATAGEARDLLADPRVASGDLDVPVATAGVSTAGTGAGGSATPSLRTIGAPTVWSGHGLTGRGALVGSIDTGVNPAHPDLAGRIPAFRNFVKRAPGAVRRRGATAPTRSGR